MGFTWNLADESWEKRHLAIKRFIDVKATNQSLASWKKRQVTLQHQKHLFKASNSLTDYSESKLMAIRILSSLKIH
jgi:hypothetical protein